MSSDEEETTRGDEPRGAHGLPIPFGSKKMKTEWLRKITTELEVPSTAPVTELRLMLEGKLTEMEKQPQNVQAVIAHTEEEGGASMLSLQDENGSFLEILLEVEGPEDRELSEEESGDDLREQVRVLQEELQATRTALEEAEREVTQQRADKERLAESTVPQEEFDGLVTQLEEQKTKVKSIWRMNCDQITMYDVECSNRDTVIATLEARVSELETAGAHVGEVTVHSAEATRILSAGAPRMSETPPSVSSVSDATSRGGQVHSVPLVEGGKPHLLTHSRLRILK